MSSEVQSEAVFDDRGRGAPPPSRGGESDGAPREQQWNGNKGNRPSAPGGIFGGGVYESDQQRAEVDQQRAQADRAMALRQHEQVQPVNRPKNNESSLAGGIFGGPMADDTPRQGVEKKNYSNRSSLDGGIFGSDENAMRANIALTSARGKRNANASSIPGGIFG